MSGLREPAGGLPPEVYWRRRIVAAIGLVIALVVIFLLVSSPGGGDDKKDTPATSETPNSTAAANPTSSPDATDVSRACTSADVQLTLTPNPLKVAAGAMPVFDVAIKNSGGAPCLLDTAAEGTEFVVWSGGESNKDIYYSTAYCPDDATITARQLLLQSGAEEPYSVTWSRERKGEGCVTGGAPGAGFYWAQLTIQGVASEPAQFELSA